jgi:hypothetical protein
MLRGWGFAGFKKQFGRFLAAYEPNHPRYFKALHHVYHGALRGTDKWGLLDKSLNSRDAYPVRPN